MNKFFWILLSVILIAGSGCGEKKSRPAKAPEAKTNELAKNSDSTSPPENESIQDAVLGDTEMPANGANNKGNGKDKDSKKETEAAESVPATPVVIGTVPDMERASEVKSSESGVSTFTKIWDNTLGWPMRAIFGSDEDEKDPAKASGGDVSHQASVTQAPSAAVEVPVDSEELQRYEHYFGLLKDRMEAKNAYPAQVRQTKLLPGSGKEMWATGDVEMTAERHAKDFVDAGIRFSLFQSLMGYFATISREKGNRVLSSAQLIEKFREILSDSVNIKHYKEVLTYVYSLAAPDKNGKLSLWTESEAVEHAKTIVSRKLDFEKLKQLYAGLSQDRISENEGASTVLDSRGAFGVALEIAQKNLDPDRVYGMYRFLLEHTAFDADISKARSQALTALQRAVVVISENFHEENFKRAYLYIQHAKRLINTPIYSDEEAFHKASVWVKGHLSLDELEDYSLYFTFLKSSESEYVYWVKEALDQAQVMVEKKILLDQFYATLDFLSRNVSTIGDVTSGYASKKLVLYAVKFISEGISLDQFKTTYDALSGLKEDTRGTPVYLSVARGDSMEAKKALLIYVTLKLLESQKLGDFLGLYTYLNSIMDQHGEKVILSQAEAFLIVSVLFENTDFDASAFQAKVKSNLDLTDTNGNPKYFGKDAVMEALKEFKLYSEAMRHELETPNGISVQRSTSIAGYAVQSLYHKLFGN
ncbi:MAG: hypothetical protein HY390_03370 [Deltaproteobacteria bacterium]|nr:hypothetical protein [Deltaproteobacteria bacterium]